MEELHLPHAKLLFAINQLLKEGRISEEENMFLKDEVLNESPEISRTMEGNPDEAELKTRMEEYAKSKLAQDNEMSIPIPAPVIDRDTMTSPVDSYLIEAKRNHMLQSKLNGDEEHKSTLKEGISKCDMGQSPVLQSSKFLESEIGYKE
eukprot:TRINITY_DN11842_c0_g1_i1.p1 TRINITY_DN11842_c0_g1~~TRINITY_DN11842_c0_g1_i1.p1  ORF type:complete len:149 (-),score=23.50 TRINITY_DN11842_c0_g1_i1:35-481(-)